MYMLHMAYRKLVTVTQTNIFNYLRPSTVDCQVIEISFFPDRSYLHSQRKNDEEGKKMQAFSMLSYVLCVCQWSISKCLGENEKSSMLLLWSLLCRFCKNLPVLSADNSFHHGE